MRLWLSGLLLGIAPPALAADMPLEMRGWFGLERFEDMNCANNPVWLDAKPGGDRLELRWRKSVAYADGSSAADTAFVIVGVDGANIYGVRAGDGVAAWFRFAPDFLRFDYLEGEAIEHADDPDLRVTFVRCEFQGS